MDTCFDGDAYNKYTEFVYVFGTVVFRFMTYTMVWRKPALEAWLCRSLVVIHDDDDKRAARDYGPAGIKKKLYIRSNSVRERCATDTRAGGDPASNHREVAAADIWYAGHVGKTMGARRIDRLGGYGASVITLLHTLQYI